MHLSTPVQLPDPRNDIDWSNLSPHGELHSNGHIEVRHSKSCNAWSAPVAIKSANISVSGMCPGLNYGQQCYEGLKAFRTRSGNITIFRPDLHADRMARSAESICLPPPPKELFLQCVHKAVALNAEFVPPAGSDAYLYIRPVLFGSSAAVALGPPEETILAVFVLPLRPYHGSEALDGVVLDNFDRAAPRGMGAFKVGGNYAPVWKHAARAKAMGFGITLHLDSAERTYVEEFSTSGFLGHKKVLDRHVLVAPASDNAIASVTRDSMVQLAKKASWLVEDAPLPFASIAELDEIVAVGTAAAVVPIRSISRLSTSEMYRLDGLAGHLLGLAGKLLGIQQGRNDDVYQWCDKLKSYH